MVLRACKNLLRYSYAAFLSAGLLSCSFYGPLEQRVMNTGRSHKVTKNLRVMTANIASGDGNNHDCVYWRTGTPGLKGLEIIANRENVDILCTQEIGESFAYHENQPKKLAENTGLVNYFFGVNSSFQIPFFSAIGFTNGISIHSRLFLGDSKKFSFKADDPCLPAMAGLFLEVKGFIHSKVYYVPPGYGHVPIKMFPINIICTHLTSTDFAERKREFEIREVFEYAARHTPAILMGDFNTVPLGARSIGTYPHGTNYEGDESWNIVKLVEKEFDVHIDYDQRLHLFDEDAFPEMPATFLGTPEKSMFNKPVIPDISIPQEIIDYIFVVTSKADKIRVNLKSTKVDYSLRISDHAPVIADIEIE